VSIACVVHCGFIFASALNKCITDSRSNSHFRILKCNAPDHSYVIQGVQFIVRPIL
jgi:hypothetical protein